VEGADPADEPAQDLQCLAVDAGGVARDAEHREADGAGLGGGSGGLRARASNWRKAALKASGVTISSMDDTRPSPIQPAAAPRSTTESGCGASPGSRASGRGRGVVVEGSAPPWRARKSQAARAGPRAGDPTVSPSAAAVGGGQSGGRPAGRVPLWLFQPTWRRAGPSGGDPCSLDRVIST
jgi:hypothetical protein